MNTTDPLTRFARIGARIKVTERPRRRFTDSPGVVRLDVQADHRTITLLGWHQVLMNTENQSQALRNVAFLD